MVTKRDFFDYMSEIYDEKYKDNDAYEVYQDIIKCKDKEKLNELHDLTLMTKQQRLIYRHSLSVVGRELTPHQVDQYITAIDYALRNRKTT